MNLAAVEKALLGCNTLIIHLLFYRLIIIDLNLYNLVIVCLRHKYSIDLHEHLESNMAINVSSAIPLVTKGVFGNYTFPDGFH